MSLLQNSNAISAGGYDINNSVRLRRSASAYLQRTSSHSTQTYTYSFWMKKGPSNVSAEYIFGYYNGAGSSAGFRITSDQLEWYSYALGMNAQVLTTQVFRDPSAWYHVVGVMDTTNATSTERIRLYINGVRVTAGTFTYPSLNFNTYMGNNLAWAWGISGGSTSGSTYFDGYLTEINVIDGQALNASYFGETDAVTGSWKPKKYTGTYGTGGYYLPFNHTETNENLLTYSEQFDNAAWNKVNFTATANSIASPLGAVVADRILETTANALHACLPTASLAVFPNLVYTFSVYVKSLNNQYVQLVFDDTATINGGYANFDLTAGTVTQSGNYGVGSNIGAAITSLGSGWYRISISTKLGLGTNARASINGIQSGTSGVFPNYVGNTSNGYYVWGAQVNYGSTANDYILTTASIVNQRGTTENSFTYSQDFTNAAWTKNASTITANTTTAPDGTTTASKLVENATLDGHQLYRTFTESNITRTLSVYAKLADASRPYVSIAMSDFVAYECRGTFNISNGTIFSTSTANANWTNISTSITSVGNGWYRCTLTATKGAVNPTIATIIGLADASGNPYYTGSGTTLGTFIWGAQFEETSSVGPYWPTVASAQSKVFRIGADKSLGATGFGYNSWIPNNTSLTYDTTYDAMTDSPTNTSATVANYAVLNPLDKGTSLTLSQANLSGSISTTWNIAKGTFGNSSGKWYYEFQFSGTSALIGICGEVTNLATNLGVSARDYGYQSSAAKWNNNVSTSYGASWTAGDIIGVAYDLDAGTIEFYKNGTSQGVAYSGIPAGTYFPAVSIYNSTLWTNFGQRPFAYTPPTGYKALNTYNLPDSTIKKGNRYMDATTYTGTGSSLTVTNAGAFKPDFLWIKGRSGATDHQLLDTVRSAKNVLVSNSTAVETVYGADQVAFNSNGFTVGGLSTMNTNTATYVGWQWQAGQGTTSSNTSGSITSTVSVNTTAGFSIVSFAYPTVASKTIGHGLGVAPKMIILKSRSTATLWAVYHASTGNTGYLSLSTTDAFSTNSTVWDNTSPTSSVFTLGSGFTSAGYGANGIAYCWAEIAGFSKFGSYTGNGSTDGTFVYTGFRPKYIMHKRTDTTSDWIVLDTSRDTYNYSDKELYPDLSNAEGVGGSTNAHDLLSNGFKLRSANAQSNASGGTYIYAAFAENPFKNSLAR